MIAGFVFRTSLSVGHVDCLSPSAAARSVQECVTKDTTASKSRFSWTLEEWFFRVTSAVCLVYQYSLLYLCLLG